MRASISILTLAALLLAGTGPLAPVAEAQQLEQQALETGGGVFPYELVNYTQAGHEFRVANAEVVVLGHVTGYREIQGVNKGLNWLVELRVESFLKTDRPAQKKTKTLSFRCMPLKAPYDEIREGDRCLVLLVRDQMIDNALILPTDMDYYPVGEDGQAVKFFKPFPTAEEPERREVPLATLREEIQSVLRRISVEQQARDAELVFMGTVARSHQAQEGMDPELVFTTVEPEKIFKGDPGKGLVTLVDRNNIQKHTLESLNRSGFKAGQKVLVFANKDPTFSATGSSNPQGEPRYRVLSGRQSVWFVARRNTWRSGMNPVPNDDFLAMIEKAVGEISD